MNNFTKAFFTTKSKLTSLVFLAFFALSLFPEFATAQPWTYDFGTGTGTHPTNSSSTAFFTSTPSGGGTYRVRTGTASGTIVLANVGTSLGTATEVQIQSATSTSSNKFGIYDWTSPSTVAYLKTKIRTTSSGNGNLNISFGINTLANDNQGYTSHYNNSLASLTIVYTSGAISSVVRRINGSNTTISSSGFAKDTDQEIEIYSNNGSGTQNYFRNGTSYSLVTKTWDCWLGGTRIVNNGATAGTLAVGNLSGFSFFAESSTSNAAFMYLDDLEYANELPKIFISDNGTQVATANINESTNNHILHKIKIDAVSGLSTNLTGMTCTTAGGYDAADITNLKVRYSTDATLDGADATLSTLTSPGAAGAKTFPSFTSQTITGGTPGYIFITADIAASSASGGNTINVNALTTSNLTFSTGIKTGTTTIGGTQTIITANSITTSTISTTSYCAGDAISVPYSISGTYSSNTFTAQISTSSTFASGVLSLGTLVSDIAGTISGTVPANTTTNGTYYVRIISNSPAVNGSNSATTISVNNSTTTVTPTTTQTIPFSTNGTTLTVTEGSTPTSRKWRSSATSGSGYTDISGETATTYVPNFALAGTYYVVCESTYPSPCGVVTTTSTEVQIDVTSVAAPVISSSLTASGTYKSAIATYTITATNSPTSYNATGLPAGLAINTTNGEITGTPTTSGTFNIAISATNAGGTGNATLVFTINKVVLTVTGASAQNKVYDRNTSATITGSTLVGIVGGDTVTITTSGTFASFNVATGIVVTSTQTLGGANAGDYTLTQPTGLTADITAKSLTISGATVTSKAYTGTNTATITGGSLAGVVAPDAVTFSGGGTFASVNVGAGISVTPTLTLGGADAGNYSLSQPTLTGTITTAPLTITGLTGVNKVYDSTTTASFTGTAAYSGLQNSESFSVTGTPSATFATKTVANSKPITITGYTAPSSNYTVSQPTGLTGNITAFNLTVTGATASNKVYDRATTATLTGSTLVGVFGGDTVTITTSGTFASVDVASGIAVTSTQTLGGGDAANYTVTLPTGLTANITQKALTITSAATSNKVYDGNTSATITGTLSGIIAPDIVTLNGTGTFASSAIANGISVTSTSTLAGAQAGNYSLTQPTGLTANITPNALSDVSFNRSSSASTNTNTDYTQYQGTTLTSTGTGTNGSVGVMGFYLRDGGAALSDLDTVGTELTAISFNVTNVANIRSARLFDGTTALGTPVNVTTSPIVFTGLTGVIAGDDSQLALNLRITFESTVTDNQQMQFTVSSVTANATGSTFTAANGGGAVSSTTGDINRIEVTADRLAFVATPTTTAISAVMTAVTVEGRDSLSNRDLDYSGSIAITSTGTLTGTPVNASAVSGLATYSSLTHTVVGTGYTLTATTTGLASSNTITSGTFNITNVPANSYRTTAAGTWTSGGGTATWERLISGTWTANAAPAFNSANNIYIRHAIPITGSTSAASVIVENGGTLTNSSSCTYGGTLLRVETGGVLQVNASITVGGTFEVQDGATVNINFAFGTPSSSIWSGTENFHPNSNLVLQNWDAAGDILIPDNTAISTNTYSGYSAVFGNIICDFGTNLGASDDLIFLASGVNINMAHGDLIFRTNDNSLITPATADMRIATTGTVTSGIGGDFSVEDTYGATQLINLKTSGTLTFTIKGDMILDASTTRVLASSIAGSSTTLNIDGNLTITPSAVLDFNSSVAGGPPAPLSVINLKGDLTGTGSGLLQNSNTSSLGQLNFTGIGDGLTASTTQTIDIASTSTSENKNIIFSVKSGAYVQLATRNFELGNNSEVIVESGGVFDFGFNGTTPLVVGISGSQTGTKFTSQQGSTLKITSTDGINTSGALGNVNVVASNRSFSQVATFHYIGKANQVTGNGITTGSSAKIIICDLVDNTTQLSFTNSTGITSTTTISATGGKLDIRKGQVIESDTAYISGSTGTLYMSSGTLYKVSLNSTSTSDLIPRLDGVAFAYSLPGGTIELSGATAGSGYQYLRGARDYYGLTFSGGGNKFISNALTNIGDNTTLNTGLVTIKDNNTILDVASNEFSGNAALTMTNTSLFKMSSLNKTLPELLGSYTMTGGTLEVYGSSASQTQSLRGTDGSSANINYNNIELNSIGANVAALSANVVAQAGFGVAGTMNVNSPTCFQLASGFTITDAGTSTFEIKSGATFKYGGSIATSGATGNVRTDTRTFPTTASYGFVGGTTQTTGAGLPSSMVNMYMDKTASTDFVTLSSATAVTGTLTFYKGKLDLDINNLAIGSSGSITGASASDYVVTSNTGTLTRNIAALGTFDYPIGSATAYNPSTFVWSTAPGITDYSLRYVATTASSGSGLPTTAGCVSASSLLDNGYWTGTSTGTATNSPNITFTRNGHTNAGNNINLHAIVRRDSSASTWGRAGTWSSPTSSALSATSEVSLTQSALALANNFAGEFAIATGSNDTSSAAVLSSVASTICSGTSPSLNVAITGSGSLYNIVYTDGTSNYSVTNYTSGTPFAAPTTSTNKTYSLVSVTSSGGCLGSGNSGTPNVTVGSTSTYTSGSWSPSAPASTSTAIIDGGTYNAAADITACTLQVKNSAIVTIPSTYKVTLSGALTVESGSSFTLENDSNLVQTGGTTNPNTGSIQVKRNSSSLYLLDYTLWSSSVENQNLYSFSPDTAPNRFYIYNEEGDNYNSISQTNSFTVGRGYLIRVPRTFSDTSPAVFTGVFTGKPNSGTISYAMSKSLNGYNAVGNPYPSQINVYNFIDSNISNTSGTIYFWRKRNDPNATSYATLTKLAYAANAAAGGDTGSSYFNATTPSNWVLNVGQGFIVQATSASNVVFTNSMRRGTNNSNQFFRTATKQAEEPSTFKLNLTSTNGVFSQMVLGYSADYTLGVDDGIDGLNINSNNYLCSSIEGTAYTIQGRPAFSATDTVPLEYKIENADQYSIAIEQLSGVFAGQDVFLKDKLTNSIHDLKSGPYAFGSEAGNFNDRFEIVYESPLAVNQSTFNESSVIVYKQHQELVINTGKTTLSSVKVYDVRGRLLMAKDHIDATQVRLFTGTTQEVLFVKITSATNGTVTKKVVN